MDISHTSIPHDHLSIFWEWYQPKKNNCSLLLCNTKRWDSNKNRTKMVQVNQRWQWIAQSNHPMKQHHATYLCNNHAHYKTRWATNQKMKHHKNGAQGIRLLWETDEFPFWRCLYGRDAWAIIIFPSQPCWSRENIILGFHQGKVFIFSMQKWNNTTINNESNSGVKWCNENWQ